MLDITRTWLVIITVLAATFAGVARAQTLSLESSVTAEPLEEMRRRYADGVAVTIEPRATDGQTKPDTRHQRLVALYVPQGESPSAFTPAGPFRATWRGFIRVPLRGKYRLSASGRGTFTLRVEGVDVFKSTGDDFSVTASTQVELNKGRNAFVATYDSPDPRHGDGDAFVRLYWSSSDFERETIPPDVLSHDASEVSLRDGLRKRAGRTLVATSRCLHCHQTTAQQRALLRVPELQADAPALATTGSRLNAAWVAAWLNDPVAMRPTATMPNVLAHHGEQRGAIAADIAAYLVTLRQEQVASPADLKMDDESVKLGGHLFATLGCIGCHVLPDHEDASDLEGRTPLWYVKAKFQPHALASFLREPGKHYASVRMPDFGLTPVEANQLAAFLLSRKGRAIEVGPDITTGDATRGKSHVQTEGCMNCHTFSDQASLVNQFKTMPIDQLVSRDWTVGCMAGEDGKAGKAPTFAMDDESRDALRAFASTDWTSLSRVVPAEYAQRQVRALRCDACHERDGLESLWGYFADSVESFKVTKPNADQPAEADPFNDDPFNTGNAAEGGGPPIDQSRPKLTLIGEKLRPDWMAKMIGGTLDYKSRPWMAARMPGFVERADMLAKGLAMSHGFSPVAEARPQPDAARVAIGRKLVAQQGGFNCLGCHGIGDAKPTNVFEAQGVNFKYTAERLNHEYFHRWMRKPLRIASQTRMPQFANDQGKTPLVEYYNGDARQQIEAIWHYLLTGRKIEPPK